MKALHRFLIALATLLLILDGCFLLVFTVCGPKVWASALDALKPYRDYAMGAGAVLVLLGLLLWYVSRRIRPIAGDVTFKGEGGRISVGRDVIEGRLAEVAEEFPTVLKMEPTVTRAGRGVNIDLAVSVERGAQIPDVMKALQERVRESLAEDVGLTGVRNVRVKIQEVVPTDDQGAGPASVDEPGEKESPASS